MWNHRVDIRVSSPLGGRVAEGLVMLCYSAVVNEFAIGCIELQASVAARRGEETGSLQLMA